MPENQADTIRNLLLAALQRYDPTIDLSIGGSAYTQIVDPIFKAVSPDVLDTDTKTYILQVLKEQNPSLELQEGDILIDLLVKPLQILMEPLKRELAMARNRQSARYPDQLTIGDAEDLAANFFVNRKVGDYARGSVRVLLSSPSFIAIGDQVRFSTYDNLSFYPTSKQFISADTVALNKLGSLYYADIPVIAEKRGEEYNVAAGTVTSAEGIPNYVSVSNPFEFEIGEKTETGRELLARTRDSLTERSLVTRRGIKARLHDEFPSLKDIEVIGYGDPEMERDKLTGTGDGRLLASGMSIIIGRYVLMITGYEDHQGGHTFPTKGDKVKLNFWKFIYPDPVVETHEIEEALYNSYADIENAPTVHLFILKENVEQGMPVTGALPGVLPGVFVSVFGNPTISVSGLPEGIYDENGTEPLSVPSDTVHIGGRHDIWVRPTAVEDDTGSLVIHKTDKVLSTLSVFTEGEPVQGLEGLAPANRIGTPYTLTAPVNNLIVREIVMGVSSQAMGLIAVRSTSSTELQIINRTGSFEVGEGIIGLTSGATSSVLSIDYTEHSKDLIGQAITLVSENYTNSFVILEAKENYLYVNVDIDEQHLTVPAYTYRETGVDNIFDPSFRIYPENAEYTAGLQTYIGSGTVTIDTDLVAEGVAIGQVLDILSGVDKGTYYIQTVNLVAPGITQLTLDSTLTRTNSNLRYAISTDETPIEAPLIRIKPSGLLIDGDSPQVIPYGKAVGSYALGAFSNAKSTYTGVNGWVLPNLPETFSGGGMLVGDLQMQANPRYTDLFTNGGVDDSITTGCKPCDGIPVTCTVTINGTPTNYSTVLFYVSGLVGELARKWLNALRDWLVDQIEAIFIGLNSQSRQTADDLIAFVNSFAFVRLGEPTNPSEIIIKQFEICIPEALFDGCNNSFIAIPEFDWASEFESVPTFAEAMNRFMAGTMKAKPTSLQYAQEGGVLEIEQGANHGTYVIDKVVNIPVFNNESVLTTEVLDENQVPSLVQSISPDKAYMLTLVTIKGTFKTEVWKGASDFFTVEIPNLSPNLPAISSVLVNTETRYVSGNQAGTVVNPFTVLEEIYTTMFKTLHTMGLDFPDEFSLDPSSTLQKLVTNLFNPYTIGNRSSLQTVRMLFQEASDVTVFSPTVCRKLTRKGAEHTPPSVTSSIFSLPNSLLAGKSIALHYALNSSQAVITLSGTLSGDIDEDTTIEELVEYIQDALDPSTGTIKVTFSDEGDSLYAIRIEGRRGGQGSYMEPVADSLSDAFSMLGFASPMWAVAELALPMDASFVSDATFRKAFHYNPATSSSGAHTFPIHHTAFIYLRIEDSVPDVDMTLGAYVDVTFHYPVLPDYAFSGVLVTQLQYVEGGAPDETHLILLVPTLARTALSNHISGGTVVDSITVENTTANVTQSPFVVILDENGFANLNNGNAFYIAAPDIEAFSHTGDIKSITGARLLTDTNTLELDAYTLSIYRSSAFTVRIDHSLDEVAPQIFIDIPNFGTDLEIPAVISTLNVIGDLTSDAAPITLNAGETELSNIVGLSAVSTVDLTTDAGTITLFDAMSDDTLDDFETALATVSTKDELISILAEQINTAYALGEWVYATNIGSELVFRANTELTLESTHTADSFSLLDHLSNPSPTVHIADTTVTGATGSPIYAVGASVATAEEVSFRSKAQNGTLFSLVQDSDEAMFGVLTQEGEEYFSAILPRRLANFELDIGDLPRDGVFNEHYTGADSVEMYFTSDDGESPIDAGIRTGDTLYVYEQVFVLDNGNITDPTATKKDRVLHVRYNDTQKKVSLLDTAGTFLTPESANIQGSVIDPRDVTEVGDYIYFEDANTVARITRLTATEAYLDTEAGISTQPEVLQHGQLGDARNNEFSTTEYSFTASDVGMYLVVYGAESEQMDGSILVESVANGVATLEDDFFTAENRLHWLLVSPDFQDLGDSNVDGLNETRGVTPLRIYKGEPKEFSVTEITEYLERSKSSITVTYGDIDGGPRRGIKQPFKVVRPSEYRMTAQQMEQQGKSEGFYYFDVPSATLTPTFDSNIPANTQLTPVAHTVGLYGYDLHVHDRNLVFSSREETRMVLPAYFFPSASSGARSSAQPVERASITVEYETSELVRNLQLFTTSEVNRHLNSDPLVKHFLPGYISIEITGTQSSIDAEEGIAEYIEGLLPVDSLQLSSIERYLHSSGVSFYNHPIFINCLTHDLNRNIILTRSENKIDDDTILHDGTNRLTYFVADTGSIKVGGTL